jgi:hypothetical protein
LARPREIVWLIDFVHPQSCETARYGSAKSESHARREVWGAALWQCRHELGADVVDKIALQAWKDMNVEKGKPANLKTFSAALVKGETTAGKRTNCLSLQIAQRALSA